MKHLTFPGHITNKLFFDKCVESAFALLLPGQQYEDLKKVKEDLVDECAREKSAHKAYKKECAALKAEYNIIRLKVRQSSLSV